MQLKLRDITLDQHAQPRVQIDQDTVDDYADALRAGANFPAIIVFREQNGRETIYWLASGWHRYMAHESIGRKAIEADVRDGTLRDAILFSLSANRKHGLRIKREDKQRAVRIMLGDPEWEAWSNGQIADQCGASPALVRKIRSEISSHKTKMRLAARGGTVYEMDTSAIGSGSMSTAVAIAEPDEEEDLEAGEAQAIALDAAEKRADVLAHSVRVLKNEKEEVAQHAADATDYLRALELAVIEGEELLPGKE